MTPLLAIRVSGGFDAGPLLARLDALGKVGPSHPKVRAALETVGRIALADMLAQFDAKSRGGGGWAPLAPSTVAERGSATPMLVRSGYLRRSLIPGQAGNVLQVMPNGVVRVGTEDPNARYPQGGTAKMPARKVVVPPRAEAMKRMRDAVIFGARAAVMEASRKPSGFGAAVRRAAAVFSF